MTTIEMTPEDLRRGRRASPTYCPLARAINGKLKPKYRSTVSCSVIAIQSRANLSTLVTLDTPAAAATFVRAFDSEWNPPPLTLELEIPDRYLAETPNPGDSS